MKDGITLLHVKGGCARMVNEKELTLEERVKRLETVVSYRVGTVNLDKVKDGPERHRDAVEELRKIQKEIIGPFEIL